MNQRDRIEILNVPLDMVDMEGAVNIFKKMIDSMESKSCSLIVTPNSEIVVNAGSDEELMGIIKSADLVIPDGIGLVYASRILGFPLKERVTGIDFLSQAFNIMSENNKSVFLLGSRPGENNMPSTAELAAAKIQEVHPGIRIAGAHHGYFKTEEEEEIVAAIREAKADLLCVALGSPKQEKFMAEYRTKLGAKVAIGVGGSLDVWSGTVKRAPEFYQKHGLEWLYRFIKEPTRYKRMVALPKFILKVIFSKRKMRLK